MRSAIASSPEVLIETPRLRLRPWRESDRDAFAEMHADPEVMVDAPRPLSREKSDRKLDRYVAAFERDGLCQWAVETLDGDFIGYAGATRIPDSHPLGAHAGAGWRLVRRAWGRGYATEAARAAFEDAFRRVGVREILAYTSPDNARSQAVMARLSMRRERQLDFTADDWTGLVWSATPLSWRA
ncbi:MAG TPA: GNAT family N-acetyltransferase [Caulobacteraceae bacterium]|nr:GNAT family N-acetyltransferase [Caulobacteraceae bacterium]